MYVRSFVRQPITSHSLAYIYVDATNPMISDQSLATSRYLLSRYVIHNALPLVELAEKRHGRTSATICVPFPPSFFLEPYVRTYTTRSPSRFLAQFLNFSFVIYIIGMNECLLSSRVRRPRI